MNVSVKNMSDVIVHTEKHKPKWFWPVVITGVVVLAFALGGGLRYFTTKHNSQSRPKTASGLPQEQDDIQNLRLNNNDADASKKLEEALKTAKSVDDRYMLYIQQGHIYYDAGEWDKALGYYKKAESQKSDFTIINRLAQTYENAGDKAKAIEYYKKSIPLISKTPWQDRDKKYIEEKIAILEGRQQPQVDQDPVE